MADYTSIDRPYDAVANRIHGGTSPVISGDDLSELFNSPAAEAEFPTDIDGMGGTSTVGGSVETQPVETGQSLADLWVTTFIRSKNFKPGAVGFNIDGQTGSAEFNNVLVRGTIYATVGAIGGWTINATTITGGDATLDSTGVISLGTGNNIVKLSSVDATYRIWAGNVTAASAPFSVTKTGSISATSGTIGGWSLASTTISSAGLALDSAGSIGTSAFVSGQTGWRISADGEAEFNNIIARGEFRTAVLTKDEVHATGGSFLILGASVLLENFTSVTTPTTSTMDLKDPPSGHAQLFAVNDIVRIKDGSGLDNWLKVTAVSDQTTFYRYTVDKQSGTNGTFYPGTAVVNYKQSTDGFVMLTSDMANAPYMDIGLSGATPWTSTTNKVRVGNLGGITDAAFGALSGYGIWTDSGYFTGSIVATAGRIGGATNYWDITSGAIAAVGAGDVQIRAGQTDYDTGTGFWFGLKTGTAKLSMGVGGGRGLTWDDTNFSIRTGGTGAERTELSSSDNLLTFYNASNGIVTQIGGGSTVGSALKTTLDTSTTVGVDINTAVDGSVGLDIQSSSDVTVTGINIILSSINIANDGAGIQVSHSGGASSSHALKLTKAGTGNAINIANSGASDAISIAQTTVGGSAAARAIYAENSNTGNTAALVDLVQGGLGKTLKLTGGNSNVLAENTLYISHASSGVAALQVDKNADGKAVQITTSGSSTADQFGLYFDMTNASSGAIALISGTANKSTGTVFASLDSQFYDSSAVGGSQDKKIKIKLGVFNYYIPCYTA